MPQGPIQTTNVSLTKNRLNITTPTVVKLGAGRVAKVSVIVAGSAAGSVNDCATTGAAAAANELAPLPNAVAPLDLGFAYSTGLVIIPGTGQTLAVSYQ